MSSEYPRNPIAITKVGAAPEHSNEYQELVEAAQSYLGWGQHDEGCAVIEEGEDCNCGMIDAEQRLSAALSALKLPHAGDGEGRYQQGDHIIYTGDDGSLRIRGEIIENVEGWWLVRWLADSSTSIVRPSRILPTPPNAVRGETEIPPLSETADQLQPSRSQR